MEKALVADASIALNRFGYGARPGDSVSDDPKRWLVAQFDHYDARPPVIAAAPTGKTISAQLAQYMSGKQPNGRPFTKRPAAPPQAMSGTAMASMTAASSDSQESQRVAELRSATKLVARDNYLALLGARTDTTLVSDAPFVERLVHFWSNHFAVSADKLTLIGLCGAFEMEAIRPHVLGRFSDMLNAVERHPAMLLFLDQAQSIGPDSAIGARIGARGRRKVGLNENLGREIMELHTLGVRTGYTQADVTEFARALTGWTVGAIGKGPGAKQAGLDDVQPGAFVFAPALHEPGTRTIMGKHYAQAGEAQAQAVLDDLAASPATAAHIATKLARHFTSDTPPPTLVARLQAAFLQSHGDLPTLYRTLIDSPEVWAPQDGKFKSPWEWSISAYRAVGAREVKPPVFTGLMKQLGQEVWRPGSPAGFDDVTGTWAGPDAVLRRVDAAQRFGAQAGDSLDARALAPELFPAALTAGTGQALARAESPQQALALLLVAPEFMRR